MSLWKQSVIVTCTTKEIVVLYRSSYFRLHKTTEKTLLLLPTKTQRYFTGTVWGGVGGGMLQFCSYLVFLPVYCLVLRNYMVHVVSG
jgi:hypothetical protein